MRRIFAHLLLSIATLLFALPMTAGAQQASVGPACDCWCEGTKSAQQLKGKTTAEACVASCANNGQKFLACSRTLDEHPDTYAYCFTREQCTGFASPDGNVTGEFQDEASKCSPERGYCFPVNKNPIKLNFSLGSVTTVQDLGDYISAAYNFALGAAVTIAIVLLMIGGLRYVLAAQTGETAKAKGMITNAVIGLVLLLGAYVILFTVNPQLTKLSAPSLPMARQVAITDGFNCEKLQKSGYEIGDKDHKPLPNPANLKCGEKGLILKNEKGVEVGSGTLCAFFGSDENGRGCNGDSAKQCVVGADGKGSCAGCQEVVADPDENTSGLDPSSAVCTSLKKPDEPENPPGDIPKIANYCFYSHDLNVIVGGLPVAAYTAAAAGAFVVSGGTAGAVVAGVALADFGDDVLRGTCSELSITCSRMSKCANYNSLEAENATTDGNLTGIEPGGGDLSMMNICKDDPCGAGAKEKSSCVYNTADNTCASKADQQKQFNEDQQPTSRFSPGEPRL